MTYQPHTQADDFKDLNYTLWRLRREHGQRHYAEVNRILNERPRTRSEEIH